MFTLDQLQACIANPNLADWIDVLTQNLTNSGIDTPARQAAFLAQCGHESGDFHEIVENLNYSAAGLRATFPRYFPTEAVAEQYQRQPQLIANVVYANRMGNGNTDSGDGYAFRGRGLISITGRDNYTQCSQDMNNDTSMVDNPDLLADPNGAVASACWFWNKHSLNDLADAGDNASFQRITQIINGGQIGQSDRVRRWNICKQALGV